MSDNLDIPKVQKPKDRLTITVNEKDQEVFMSGGLIRQLAPIASSLGEFTQIFQNADIQEALIITALRPRTLAGQPVVKDLNYSLDDFVMSTDEMDKLIAWIADHVLYFFVNSLSAAKSLMDSNSDTMKRLDQLTRSLIGSQASTESNPSVGPSESSPAV